MGFRQRPKENRSKELDRLIERINTEDIATISSLLEKNGKELLLYCLENPDKLRIRGVEGYTIADTIASYGPTDVVKLLLERAKTDDKIKKLVAETHELEGGVQIETFALAIATIRSRDEDDTPYMALANEIKLLSRIADQN